MPNEITKQPPKANIIISQMQDQFAKVLPKMITPERYCRVVLSAMNKNTALAEAIADPDNRASVLSAFMRCAELGLEPDGRRAVINCYKRGNTGKYDVTLIPMFQGLAELVMRSGLVSNIHADKVCEKDNFVWDTGEIHHTINFREPRGPVYAYYCIVKFKDGSVKTETMSLDEVNAIRDRSTAYQAAKKYGKTCPWMTDPEEMGKKTVFRRCSKWLPLSAEQRAVIEADDDDYRETAASVVAGAGNKFAQATGALDMASAQEENAVEVPTEDKTATPATPAPEGGLL